jgi:hypothetical protein
LFQSRVLVIYDELVREFGLDVIDATADISQQQQQGRVSSPPRWWAWREGTACTTGIRPSTERPPY